MNAMQFRITVIASLVAPLAILASTAGYIAAGNGMNNGEVAGIIQMWGMITYAVAIVGFARLIEERAPRGALALILVGLVGTGGGIAYGIDSIQVAFFETQNIQDTTSIAGPLAFQLAGAMFPLSLVLLGVLLARTGVAPAMLGYGLAIGAVLFPASRIPDIAPLALVSDVIVVLALAGIVVSVTRDASTPRTAPSLGR